MVDLNKGADKTAVAQRYGVSIGTVTRILRTEAGLYLTWKRACLEIARTRARDAWLEVLNGQRSLGTKFMRALEPAAYAWLYRNDRLWLDEHKPEAGCALPGPSVPSVRWDERDEVLSKKVEQATAAVLIERGKKLNLWEV